MSQVARLMVSEQAVVDQDELMRVLVRMDPEQAHEAFQGLIKSLTDHLAVAEGQLRDRAHDQLADTMMLVEVLAGRLCMTTLKQVARDVITCCKREEPVALTSTHARLLRVGESALREIWELKRAYT